MAKRGAAGTLPAKTYTQEELSRVNAVRAAGVELQRLALALAQHGEAELSARVLAAAYKASRVKGRPEPQA